MSLILVGVNHRTAPVEVREQLSVPEKEVPQFLAQLRASDGIRGSYVLSTCNRVEIVVSSSNEDSVEPIVSLLAARSSFSREEIERHLYILRHGDVVRHLFRVASGLDSMILGEPQIAGQVRNGYQLAKDNNSLDPILSKLFENTFRVAKKVRTDTGIGEHAVSVPFAAVELAKKIFGELEGRTVLLVGAGEMGELTAQHLCGQGVKKVFVANRAFERAKELATRFEGEAIQFDVFPEHLRGCDIVIVSTAAPHYVVTQKHIEAAARRRGNVFLIDLSVPRNIDPKIGDLDGAYLYNIDDLQEVADTNREKRLQKAQVADQIVDEEVTGFLRHLSSQDVVPTIVELQRRLDEIRLAELEKCLRKIGPMSTEQRAAIEQLSTGIINKVAHYPILRLKESAADGEPQRIRETILKIFGLR